MAHFAELNSDNQVLRVIVVSNKDCMVNGVEVEEAGVVFCKTLFGAETIWKQTSYHGNFRKNYAGTGFTYDATKDAFIPPQPFASWVLDESRCIWQPPIDCPVDENVYDWNEDTQTWDIIT